MATKTKRPTKLAGYVNWFQEPNVPPPGIQVKRAYLRSTDELEVHFESQGWEYLVKLQREDGNRFSGTFDARRGEKQVPIRANCTLYRNEGAYLAFGRWYEDGDQFLWWAELSVVRHFADEGVV